MRSLDNVPRRSSRDLDAFVSEHLRPGRPVVLTGLFDGQPIRALDTVDAAAARLGEMILGVSGNFAVERLRGRTPERRAMRLAAYLEHVRARPDTREYCYLEAPPPALRELFRAPPLCDREAADDTVSLVFLGNAGNFSHLHYDEDLRDVLMYQVFGRKRYVLFDPSVAHKLDPLVAPGVVRTSSVCLQHMDPPEQLDFLRYAGAWDVVLAPGETLLMPRACWHYVEYVDTALSLNFRLGRSAPTRALAELMPQPSVFLQSLAVRFGDPDALTDEDRSVLERLVALGPAPDDAVLHAAVVEAYDQLCGGGSSRPHTLRFAELRDHVLVQPRG